MPNGDISLLRTLRLLAAGLALLLAVSLPLGYWLVVYSFAAQATANDAQVHAELVSQRINVNPDLWRFELPRLDAIVAAHPVTDGEAEQHSILDERGTLLVKNAEIVAPPILTRSAPLLDSGTVVGSFVTSRSLLAQLQNTALVGLFAVLLGLAVYISLSVLPLRALTRTLGALDQQRERLRVIVDHAVEGIITFDLEGILQSLNPAAVGMFGYNSAEVVGHSAAELLPGIDMAKAGLPGGQAHLGRLEAAGRRKDGKQIQIELALSQAMLEGKLQWIAIVHDISERKRLDQVLRDSAQELRLFADNVPAMTASYDENLHIVFANKRFADFFGFDSVAIVGKHLREVAGEESYPEIEGYFVQMLQGHPVTYQRVHKLANGESRYLEIKLLPHIGDPGTVLGCFSVVVDITEHKLTEERIQRVAHHDSLTGLPNRLLFNDRLQQTISQAKRDSRQIALLYLDLDRFKSVNDSLGHTAGDELLQAVAARIRQQVRESDTVARVGGDEFAVIVPNVARPEEAEIVARKIIAAVATPFQLGSHMQSVEIGTSIGIAIYPADARDADALVKAADAAMYSAKQTGSSFRFCGAPDALGIGSTHTTINQVPGPQMDTLRRG